MRLFRPQPRISLASRSDAVALAELYARVWRDLRGTVSEQLIQDQSASPEEIEVWLRGGFELYAARMNQELAGAVRCSFPTGTCLVDRLAVVPELRRRGIGQALAEHALSRAKRAGVTRVWLNVPARLEAARELYRGLGFRESIKINVPEQGDEVVLMELSI